MRSFFSGLFVGILLFLLISVVHIDIFPHLETLIHSRYVRTAGTLFIIIEILFTLFFIVRWICIVIEEVEYDNITPFFGVPLISMPSKLFNKLSNRGVK